MISLTSSKTLNKTVLADILLLVVTILAAFGWIFSSHVLMDFSPFWFLALRFSGAGLVLLFLSGFSLKGLSFPQWRFLILAGGLMGIAMLFWVSGLFETEFVGEGAFILSAGLVSVPLFTRFLFKEKMAVSAMVAIVLAIAGLACLVLVDFHWQASNAQWYFLISAILFALHFIVNSQFAMDIRLEISIGVQLCMVGAIACCAALVVGEQWPGIISTATYVWLAASIFIATALRFLMQLYAQRLTKASHGAVWFILEPVWTVLLAQVFFDEHMQGQQWFGCGIIFLALLASRWPMMVSLVRRYA